MFNNSNYEKILLSSPNISALKILRTHGYRKESLIKPRVLDAANKAVEQLTFYSSPEGYLCIKKIRKKFSDYIELHCGTVLKCGIFKERLIKSEFLIVFILTLGKGIDEIIKKNSNDLEEPLGAIFLENASWLALELILREARFRIINFAKTRNMLIENRMAPGYSYPSKILKKRIMWELEEQEILFKLFHGNNISVRLNDSFTMIPRMSRSGIFGLKKSYK